MRTLHLARSCLLAASLAAALASAAPAQVPAPPDSGLLVVFDHDVAIAHERHHYEFQGDSLVVSATIQRQLVDEQGNRHAFTKSMVLVADALDMGLRRYLSNQDFQDHKWVRGILPGDTVMTYYAEYDGAGDALRLVQPPGRLFVLDSQLFTLFDVLTRSLADRQFKTRRVQLLALAADTLTTPVATLTLVDADTVRVGGKRVPARHYTLDDEGVRFELWADPQGRMLRLLNEPAGLSVESVPEAPPAAPRRRSTSRR